VVQSFTDEVEVRRPLPGLQARDGLGRRFIWVVKTEARMKLDDDGPPLPPSVAKLIRDLAT
jgi:hypothetical protein